MKKIINWLVAAILICGSSVVLSSCSKDDGNGTYEVNLSVVLPESAARLYTLDVEYTDGNGKTYTTTVKAGDQSEAMSTETKFEYERAKEYEIDMLDWYDERAMLFDKLIVKNFKITALDGTGFSYIVTMKGRSDYVKPSTDKFYFVMPFVHSYWTRISGNNHDYYSKFESAPMGAVRGMGPFDPSKVDDLISRYDGAVIGVHTGYSPLSSSTR